MQFSGSSWQSRSQRKRSQAIHPIGGVLSSPLSRVTVRETRTRNRVTDKGCISNRRHAHERLLTHTHTQTTAVILWLSRIVSKHWSEAAIKLMQIIKVTMSYLFAWGFSCTQLIWTVTRLASLLPGLCLKQQCLSLPGKVCWESCDCSMSHECVTWWNRKQVVCCVPMLVFLYCSRICVFWLAAHTGSAHIKKHCVFTAVYV